LEVRIDYGRIKVLKSTKLGKKKIKGLKSLPFHLAYTDWYMLVNPAELHMARLLSGAVIQSMNDLHCVTGAPFVTRFSGCQRAYWLVPWLSTESITC